jgi:Flp pilus assembly protein TadG
MSENTTSTKLKRPLFVLTRKNQKGQVAIFVALIFQVIFVFFALLINVGLLVHHKINLQQSTDLAAYYGAMKQAEILNTIAHVNFQVKQTFKLLTWRYRVLGTFGFRKGKNATSPDEQNYPYENVTANPANYFQYNGSMGSPATNGPNSMRCPFPPPPSAPTDFLGIQDIPFFCVGHAGIPSWSQDESMCNVSCANFISGRTVSRIQIPVNNGNIPFSGNLTNAIITTLQTANNHIDELCKALGPRGANAFARCWQKTCH